MYNSCKVQTNWKTTYSSSLGTKKTPDAWCLMASLERHSINLCNDWRVIYGNILCPQSPDQLVCSLYQSQSRTSCSKWFFLISWNCWIITRQYTSKDTSICITHVRFRQIEKQPIAHLWPQNKTHLLDSSL